MQENKWTQYIITIIIVLIKPISTAREHGKPFVEAFSMTLVVFITTCSSLSSPNNTSLLTS